MSTSNDNVSEGDVLILMEIIDGYSFRNLVDYLRSSNTEGNFICDKKTIRYIEPNGDNSLLNDLEIDTWNFSTYVFNSDEDIFIGVCLAELQAATKIIGKKESVRLYMCHDDPHLYIQTINNARVISRSNVNAIRTKTVEYNTIEAPDHIRPDDEPNAVAMVTDFSKTCKSMSSLDSSLISFYGYPKGVKICAYGEGHLTNKAEKFGVCPDFPSSGMKLPNIKSIISQRAAEGQSGPIKIQLKPIVEGNVIKIPKTTVAALSKINNTSQNGIVKLYFENMFIRCALPVGHYGRLRIYMREPPEDA